MSLQQEQQSSKGIVYVLPKTQHTHISAEDEPGLVEYFFSFKSNYPHREGYPL